MKSAFDQEKPGKFKSQYDFKGTAVESSATNTKRIPVQQQKKVPSRNPAHQTWTTLPNKNFNFNTTTSSILKSGASLQDIQKLQKIQEARHQHRKMFQFLQQSMMPASGSPAKTSEGNPVKPKQSFNKSAYNKLFRNASKQPTSQTVVRPKKLND